MYINRYLDDCQCAGFCSQICMEFFTVCECVLGEKFAMSSARIGLRGLYCFFFIEFHL